MTCDESAGIIKRYYKKTVQHNGTERRDLVKMKKLWKKAAALFTAACLTAACCPAFSAAEESSGKASAALASFKADGDVLVNRRSDGEKLHIGGARESRSAVAINGSGFASFDVSTLAADGFTAFVGLDETSGAAAKTKFFVEADG